MTTVQGRVVLRFTTTPTLSDVARLRLRTLSSCVFVRCPLFVGEPHLHTPLARVLRLRRSSEFAHLLICSRAERVVELFICPRA